VVCSSLHRESLPEAREDVLDRTSLIDLLSRVRSGDVDPTHAATEIASLSIRDVGHDAKVDGMRSLRTGLPEVVYGESKTAEQCARIAAELDRLGHPVLVTRLDASKAGAVCEAVPEGRYHPECRVFARGRGADPNPLRGPVAIIAAGTSDLPWAEEAAVTLETIGQPVLRFYDVGVAGLHRLLSRVAEIRRAGVCIVAAGMEGALPTVVGGLVAVPVIAVPTPVGYGAGAGGIAALLGMLNSCSPNVVVVNIGNGLGAAYTAALANRLTPMASPESPQ
jgi:NCAIR mutase (PurE)-related protein